MRSVLSIETCESGKIIFFEESEKYLKRGI